MLDEPAAFQENIRRVRVLASELGLQTGEAHAGAGQWRLDFMSASLHAGFELDPDAAFVRITARLTLDAAYADWFSLRLDDLQQVCYHYGCYHLVSLESGQIVVLLGLTLYFGGLQYYALKEAINDLERAVIEIRQLLETGIEPVEGGSNGYSQSHGRQGDPDS